MWSHLKFLNEYRRAVAGRVVTVERKNTDYAGATPDPFGNFRLVEVMTNGRLSMEDGIFVRMTDKLARVATLLTADPAVIEETFADTCGDLSAYADLLALARRSRTEPDDSQPAPAPVAAETQAQMPAGAMEQLRAYLAARMPGVFAGNTEGNG